MFTITQLHGIIEKRPRGIQQQAAECLLDAMADWKTPVNTLEDYFGQIKKQLKQKEITKKTLELEIESMSPENRSWEIESLSSLIKAFSISGTIELNTLYEFLSE
jgi:hypothetical protein